MEQSKVKEFIGINAVGTGVSIVNREMLDNGDYAGIEELARQHVQAVEKFR